MKTCAKCLLEQPLTQYTFRSDRKELDYFDLKRRHSWCRTCINTRSRELYAGSEGRRLAAARRMGTEAVKRRRSERMYGMAEGSYAVMYDRQQGLCKICHIPANVLQIDHNHDTGAVRGLLCSHCNRAIGMMLDDPAILRAAADYLDKDGET